MRSRTFAFVVSLAVLYGVHDAYAAERKTEKRAGSGDAGGDASATAPVVITITPSPGTAPGASEASSPAGEQQPALAPMVVPLPDLTPPEPSEDLGLEGDKHLEIAPFKKTSEQRGSEQRASGRLAPDASPTALPPSPVTAPQPFGAASPSVVPALVSGSNEKNAAPKTEQKSGTAPTTAVTPATAAAPTTAQDATAKEPAVAPSVATAAVPAAVERPSRWVRTPRLIASGGGALGLAVIGVGVVNGLNARTAEIAYREARTQIDALDAQRDAERAGTRANTLFAVGGALAAAAVGVAVLDAFDVFGGDESQSNGIPNSRVGIVFSHSGVDIVWTAEFP